MGRTPCCSKEGLNRGAWTAMEDKILTEYIQVHGEGKWRCLPKRAGLKRCGKSCRLRWLNYLRPDIKRGNITHDEEELIIRLHNLLGNRWSLIAARLPGRTDNEIKNYWNTNIGKKIQAQNSLNSNTTSRKPPSNGYKLEQLVPKPKMTNSGAQLQPHSTSSRLVRTKATRCTKVVLLPQDQPQNKLVLLDHNNQIIGSGRSSDGNHEYYTSDPVVDEVSSAVDHDDQLVNYCDDQTVGPDHSLPFHVPDKSDSSHFMSVDFETDHENIFLSELHNIDFGFRDDVAGKTTSSNHKGFSCSKSENENESFLFSQDMLFGVDLELATASDLIDPADLDWLQD